MVSITWMSSCLIVSSGIINLYFGDKGLFINLALVLLYSLVFFKPLLY